MELGKVIVEIRKEHDLTQESLAELCRVTRQTISNWENGKSYPDLETIVLISDTFDVPLDTMLKGDRKMVSEITKEQKQGRRSIFKVSVALVIAAAIVFAGICIIETHESYIPYDKSGITVSEQGELFTDKNYKRHVGFRFITETVDDENHVVVFTYLTSNFFTRLFSKNQYSEKPFVGYGEVTGQSLGDNGKLLPNIVTEVYYLPSEYVEEQGLLNTKRSQLISVGTSEAEANTIIQQMKSNSILLWKR